MTSVFVHITLKCFAWVSYMQIYYIDWFIDKSVRKLAPPCHRRVLIPLKCSRNSFVLLFKWMFLFFCLHEDRLIHSYDIMHLSFHVTAYLHDQYKSFKPIAKLVNRAKHRYEQITIIALRKMHQKKHH